MNGRPFPHYLVYAYFDCYCYCCLESGREAGCFALVLLVKIKTELEDEPYRLNSGKAELEETSA